MLYLGSCKGQEINKSIRINKNVFDEYSLHLKKLLQFEQEFNLYVTVSHNYEEMIETVDAIKVDYIRDSSMSWIKMNAIMLSINRRVLNYLSTFRTYLDHAERFLKHEFGRESEQVKRFKEITAKEYDDYFAYRFLYKLRNFSQHCGMPVGSVDLNAKAVRGSETEYALHVHLERGQLLKADCWGKDVREEIEVMPPRIEITLYLKELQGCIERIQGCLMEIRMATLKDSIEYIVDLFKPLIHTEGNLCIIDDSKLTDGGGDIELKWVPMHIVQLAYGLLKENQESQ
ncbi:hypothetical protein [Bacillus sp. BR_7a]|uniref:hypothetical protein n=1 Tax=Bacillus sp. BR_7a TaxID=3055775 RepID=UPI0036610C02